MNLTKHVGWSQSDGLHSFQGEAAIAAGELDREPAPVPGGARVPAVILVSAMICGAVAATVAAQYRFSTQPSAQVAPIPAPPEVVDGSVFVSTRPEGAQVWVDGVLHGTTPLKLQMKGGDYRLELRTDTTERAIPLVVAAGSSVSQYVDLPVPVAAPALVKEKNKEPEAPIAARRRPAESTGLGWASIETPFELQVTKAGAFIGRTGAGRFVLPAGRHELDLVNEALGFRATASVVIEADETTVTRVTPPNGSLSINAQPWAEVWIDGRAAGTTPLANLEVPIGTHEVVWRHPQLGEQKQSVTVKASGPVRVGINFK